MPAHLLKHYMGGIGGMAGLVNAVPLYESLR